MTQKYLKLFVSIVLCELVGIAGTPFTTSAIPSWYAGLTKPFFAPPNWVFGPVWTILYALMGVSIFLILQKGIQKKQVRQAASIFAVQLFLNFTWSIVFFGARSPILGLINIILLASMIVLNIRLFYPLSKTAAYLLLPYLAWVSFATILNMAIFFLN